MPREALIALLDESFAGPAWHGPSLAAALRGLDARAAAWTPGPGRNTAWDLLLHCARGRHIVLGRLDRAAAGRFPRPVPRRWWPARSGGDPDEAWAADRRLLADVHARLLEALRTVSDARLAMRRAGQPRTLAAEVAGLALHDVYHAGQIVLLRRMRGPTV